MPETLYVTPTGGVFHRKRDCSRLRGNEPLRVRSDVTTKTRAITRPYIVHAKHGQRLACTTCAA